MPAADYAVPDVIVRKTRRGWQVTLNSAAVPRLQINGLYAQMLGNQKESAHAGLQAQLQQAKWMIRNVEQRFDTILQVSQAIVERQTAFFSQGPAAMRPLILKDIAGELGLHESTISRATTQKYMLTPFGTLELKRFFGRGCRPTAATPPRPRRCRPISARWWRTRIAPSPCPTARSWKSWPTRAS